jgi:hypothetical protein
MLLCNKHKIIVIWSQIPLLQNNVYYNDADHSSLSSAEVKNELELYVLSPQAPPWRVAGLLCFFCSDILGTG